MRLTAWTTSPGIPRIESIGDIGIVSFRRVLRKNKSNECRSSPDHDEEPTPQPTKVKNCFDSLVLRSCCLKPHHNAPQLRRQVETLPGFLLADITSRNRSRCK